MWKAILLITSTAVFTLIGLLAAYVGKLTPPDMFLTLVVFGVVGLLLAFFAIRAVNRNLL